MLNILENTSLSNVQLSIGDFNSKIQEEIIIKEVEKKSEIEEVIKNINPNNLTPLEALNLVNDLKSKIK